MKKFDYIKDNKDEVIKSLINIEESFHTLDELDVEDFDKKDTAIVFVDMVHGFVDEGSLSSERANDILEPIKKLDEETKGFPKIFFKDTHTEESVEFNTYPEHCIDETSESLLIEGLDIENNNSNVIEKNSINGFFAPDFNNWLKTHEKIENFIVVGLVTDICVLNFALTLKSYFNQWNVPSNIIVPVNCVETFDLDVTNHNAYLMNLFALYNMEMNGIKLMKYKGDLDE